MKTSKKIYYFGKQETKYFRFIPQKLQRLMLITFYYAVSKQNYNKRKANK